MQILGTAVSCPSRRKCLSAYFARTSPHARAICANLRHLRTKLFKVKPTTPMPQGTIGTRPRVTIVRSGPHGDEGEPAPAFLIAFQRAGSGCAQARLPPSPNHRTEPLATSHTQPKIEITLDSTTSTVHVVFMNHAPTAPVQSAPPPREISPMAAPAKPSRSATLLQIVRTLIDIGRQRLATTGPPPLSLAA